MENKKTWENENVETQTEDREENEAVAVAFVDENAGDADSTDSNCSHDENDQESGGCVAVGLSTRQRAGIILFGVILLALIVWLIIWARGITRTSDAADRNHDSETAYSETTVTPGETVPENPGINGQWIFVPTQPGSIPSTSGNNGNGGGNTTGTGNQGGKGGTSVPSGNTDPSGGTTNPGGGTTAPTNPGGESTTPTDPGNKGDDKPAPDTNGGSDSGDKTPEETTGNDQNGGNGGQNNGDNGNNAPSDYSGETKIRISTVNDDTGVVTITIEGSSIAVPLQTTYFNGRVTKSGVAQGKLFGFNAGVTVMFFYPQEEGFHTTEVNAFMNRTSDSLTVLVDINGGGSKLLIKINGMKSLF